MRHLLRRLLSRSQRDSGPAAHPDPGSLSLTRPDLPLPYSWVLTGRLAIGPMPARASHWQQLEQAGVRMRFSCCYPDEQRGGAPIPPHWLSDGLPLPDYRLQEPLDRARLLDALARAQRLLRLGAPLYVHCMAGIERSPLLAVGLTALERHLSLFDALDWVRRCHPVARPIVAHLELLEQLLAEPAL